MSEESRLPWFIGLAVGGAMFAVGLYGLIHNRVQTVPWDVLKYVAGGLVSHDALLAPAVLLVGVLLARFVPAAVRGGTQATLAIAAVVTLMAIPVLKHAGRRPDNPSLLPHDYGRNLAIVLAVIVGGGLLLTALSAARRARRSASP